MLWWIWARWHMSSNAVGRWSLLAGVRCSATVANTQHARLRAMNSGARCRHAWCCEMESALELMEAMVEIVVMNLEGCPFFRIWRMAMIALG